MADALVLLSQATAMCREDFDMKPIGTENRFGDTVKHIRRWEKFVGQLHKKHITALHSGARGNSNLEAALSDTARPVVTDLAIEESYLRRIDAGVGYSLPALNQVSGKPNAIWELSRRLKLDVTRGIMEKRNQYLNSDATAKKALVAAVYQADGSAAYSSGTTAFIKVDNGSVSSFHAGEVVDIRAGSDPGSLRFTTGTVAVKDVWPDEVWRGYTVGPGFLASIPSGNFSAVADDDEIVASGEGDYGYPATFSVVADLSASPASYFGVDRTTAGNAYLLGHGRPYSGALDIDQHFGVMFRMFSRMIPQVRDLMGEEGIELTDALVCQGSPELVAEVARQAGDSTVHFNVQVASTLDAAKRAKLVAVAGWNGHVLHTPLLPMSIVLQPEPQMAQGEIRVFDPNCWVWLTSGFDNKGNPEWVPVDERGGYWHNTRITDSGDSGANARPSLKYTAHAFTIDTPFCEQPATVYRMTGLTDSLS